MGFSLVRFSRPIRHIIGHFEDEDRNGAVQTWYMCDKGITQFTCHPHRNLSLSLLPAAGYHRLLAGTHCAYPRRDGQAELNIAYV